VIEVARADRSGAAQGWLVAMAGMGLLLVRPVVANGPEWVWLLLAIYMTLGMSAILVPPAAGLGARPAPLPIPLVLAIGVGTFALAAAIGRPALHISFDGPALAITMLAAVAEEAFFRGFLYGRLARFGAPVAVTVSAAAFALVHATGYPPAALWVDFAAGLVFGWQRWATGSWTVPAATHVAANLMVVMA
jgi:membrane protease YdiL (CAAX protease family)